MHTLTSGSLLFANVLPQTAWETKKPSEGRNKGRAQRRQWQQQQQQTSANLMCAISLGFLHKIENILLWSSLHDSMPKIHDVSSRPPNLINCMSHSITDLGLAAISQDKGVNISL